MERTSQVLAVGWLAHAIAWSLALWRARGVAAATHEWGREFGLRALMAALLVTSVTAATPGGWFRVPASAANALLGVFFAAQATAVIARLQLGRRWGVGVEPRSAVAPPLRTGVYRWLSHPIYVGCVTSLAAQALLLQDASSTTLLIGAVVVTSWKARREAALLSRPQPPEA